MNKNILKITLAVVTIAAAGALYSVVKTNPACCKGNGCNTECCGDICSCNGACDPAGCECGCECCAK